jgi:hypothetical protein
VGRAGTSAYSKSGEATRLRTNRSRKAAVSIHNNSLSAAPESNIASPIAGVRFPSSALAPSLWHFQIASAQPLCPRSAAALLSTVPGDAAAVGTLRFAAGGVTMCLSTSLGRRILESSIKRPAVNISARSSTLPNLYDMVGAIRHRCAKQRFNSSIIFLSLTSAISKSSNIPASM